MSIFDGKRFFVYGNGLSGRAACKAIKKHGGKARVYADINGMFIPPPDKDYDGAVISPGIRPTHKVYEYCAEHGIKTYSEIEIGFALSDGRKIVGVTGTNGKTTVTKLIADMVGGVACGNIGYPLCAAVLEKSEKPLVCELSSFQLYRSVISPTVAVITNVTSDHVDWHGGLKEYYAAKCNVANGMDGGYLVLGEDVSVGSLCALHTSAQIIRCSTSTVTDGAYVADGYFCFGGNRICPVDYLRLPGEHNVKNALCAIAAAKCMGADNSSVLNALSSSEPSPHRTEKAGYACGKQWIDDSKGTNVAACLAAIAQTDGTVCLILGGRGKDTDFSELFCALDKRVIEVVAMGETAQAIRDAACALSPELKISVVSSLSDAVAKAAESEAKTVLLSPACASFDEFRSYAERGERFKAAVRALGRTK